MVCADPTTHWKLQGAVHGVESTVSDRPEGAVVTVTVVKAAKLPVTLTGAFMVTFWGVMVPVKPPLNPLNW